MGEGKRAKGMATQLYILIRDKSGISLLEAQTGGSNNLTNAIEEVSPFKKMGETAANDGSRWVESTDGKRSLTISATTGRLESAAESVMQDELLSLLETKEDTTTTVFEGSVLASTGVFKGKQYEMLIASMSRDYPSDSDVTGSIEFTHKGTVRPITHTGTETFIEILAAIVGA